MQFEHLKGGVVALLHVRLVLAQEGAFEHNVRQVALGGHIVKLVAAHVTVGTLHTTDEEAEEDVSEPVAVHSWKDEEPCEGGCVRRMVVAARDAGQWGEGSSQRLQHVRCRLRQGGGWGVVQHACTMLAGGCTATARLAAVVRAGS